MKQLYTANPSPISRFAIARQHASSVASFIVLATSLALVGCLDSNDEDAPSDERETYPSFEECQAPASAEECEQAGCFVLENVTFHEYTEADGCRGGDELLCLNPGAGGNDVTGFFWRERPDGVAVTWSYGSVIWPNDPDTWQWCDPGGDIPAHPVCRCNRLWAEEKEPRGD